MNVYKLVNSFIDSLNDAKYSSIKTELNQDKIQAQSFNKTDATENEVSNAKTTLEKALANKQIR
ncbi:hypothetical protein NWQ33_00675 [Mycoplasmopsis cynos]|nr:hypothetical protein [Mycoplasmopsis cynos]